ncbi:MAG: bifunctional methylenetetrahydrofolate dehydrogenase/methenyltetrahydrofolate cyclohydrolase [Acidobacteriota bacterium]|nr:bifunctional methylenetetrahydrofolate dehydrogenase/methenyltetrahydrofolate cyclohydrolase [Acidobacteriota bacterium]
MPARVIDAADVAALFRAQTRADVARLERELCVVGLLSQSEGPAHTYAEYARRGAEDVGVTMDVWRLEPGQVPAAIREANADPALDGIFLYYPLTDQAEDRWHRELVDPRKDVEGMHSFWSRLLYENRRYVDDSRTLRAILPCTPLGILKLLDDAGLRGRGRGGRAPLEGVVACVINRSEIVGRPLSAMLANDGASVISLDLTGAVLFEPAIGRHAHTVRSIEFDRAAALRDADVVITGVPSREFELVTAAELKHGVICVNFSEFRNFDDSVLEVASAFVPRVGPMTVAMAARNLVRLTALRDHAPRA